MKRKIDFQDARHGGHLGFPIWMILAMFELRHHDDPYLDIITLNVDVINMSDVHPSLLRVVCINKLQYTTFLRLPRFWPLAPPNGMTQGSIDVEWKRTFPGTHIPNNNSCRDRSFQKKKKKLRLSQVIMDGITDGPTDEGKNGQTNGRNIENLWHTLFVGV